MTQLLILHQAKSGNDPGFAQRAQAAGDRNANAAQSGGKGGQSNKSGGAK